MSSSLFSRQMLVNVHAEVRRQFPQIRPMRDAHVWHVNNCHYEFHCEYEDNGKRQRFKSDVHASDRYEARAIGWEDFLRLRGKEAPLTPRGAFMMRGQDAFKKGRH